MEDFKKVKYASVTLDANGYGVLNVLFDDTIFYYSNSFSEEEIATMDNGSYYVMDHGLANSAHIYNGKAGLTYAYVLNGQAGIGDHKFIDIWTRCTDGSGYVGKSVKQITTKFAEEIFRQFNLPFHLEENHYRNTFEIIPNDFDSLVGKTFTIHSKEVVVESVIHTEDDDNWNTLCIHGKHDGRDFYFGFRDIPEWYPGIIGQDPNI